MTLEKPILSTDKSTTFNRIMYGAFVLLSIYFLVTKDIGSAMSNLGIALIFDPFNQKTPFNERALYQRVWLIVHGLAVMVLLGVLIFQKLI